MRNILNKLLNIPTPYVIGIGIALVIVTLSFANGTLTIPSLILITILALAIFLHIHLGYIVIKSILSIIGIIYLTAFYTNLIITTEGLIIEPFLLTIASVSIFMFVTYNSNNYTHGLRSRPLWSLVVTFILITLKMSLVISGYSFLIAEVVGMNLLVLIIILWIYWIKNAKKTKIIEPEILSTKSDEKFKYIYINDRLDEKAGKWIGKPSELRSAKPYIYNEVMKAASEKRSLVIVSKVNTNKIYDVGEIKVNKSKTIKYLYMEAKENDYVNDTLESFIEELNR